MKRKAAEAEAEAEAAEIGLLASRQKGPSQQVNAPTITTTTADVCGSTSDPVKGGEKELGIQDEENLKSKGTLPVINWSWGSKDSLQDQTKNDTYISNYDETTGHERDELMKQADLETGNKRVPTTFRGTKEKKLGNDNYITKGDELKEADHLETENKRVPYFGFGKAESFSWSRASTTLVSGRGGPLANADVYDEYFPNHSGSSCVPNAVGTSSCVRPLASKDGYDEYFPNHSGSSYVPNPGIKRPSIVIVSGPPPPPPPPTL